MFSKLIKYIKTEDKSKDKRDSLILEKMKVSGLFPVTTKFSFNNEDLEMEFASSEEMSVAMNTLEQLEIFPRSGSSKSNSYFCLFSQETVQTLLHLIDSQTDDKLAPAYQEIEKQLIQTKSGSDSKEKPLILTLPVEIICQMMMSLTYEEAFHFALCLVSGYATFNEYKNYDSHVEKKSLPVKIASKYPTSLLFISANKLKSKPLYTPGFCYLPNQGCLVWGDNYRGQLGLGHKREEKTPQFIHALKTKAIIAIAGNRHKVALTRQGEVYTWGWNYHRQLGLGHRDNKDTPQLVTALTGIEITAIAAGDGYSVALTSKGEVYTWGRNNDSQLGLGHKDDKDIPQLVTALTGIKITAIAAGEGHTVALTSKGEIYSWGRNSDGQLGLGHRDDKDIPQLVAALKGIDIIAIAAGSNHIVALTSNSEIYSWGQNHVGQLGLGHRNEKNTPQLVAALKVIEITAITVGHSHVVALTSKGEVYSWGTNYAGQLGLGHEDGKDIPQLVTALTGIKITAIASEGSHSIALASTGKVYVWGINLDNELNLGEDIRCQHTPTEFIVPQQPIAETERLNHFGA